LAVVAAVLLEEVALVAAGNNLICSKCGDANAGDARFCGSCGETLVRSGGFMMNASKILLIGLVVLLGGAVLMGGCAYSGYRNTVSLDEGVKSAWADVEVVLKRRFDLIPNVVETVKGYAKHESELLQGIADARKSYTGAGNVADKQKASGQLDGFLGRLLVIQEKYPELKANENFRTLQVELEGTENRIAEKRKRYNDNVRQLNSHIRAFPGSLYASWVGVTQAPYFEAGESAKDAPAVKF
jgi:LemA protein